ncbi:MAG: hypothetical protein H0X34_13775, partial [Chthoniobacterales bacterium]|nr:hypothetical protein [Chthoniobacterales bacterium]
ATVVVAAEAATAAVAEATAAVVAADVATAASGAGANDNQQHFQESASGNRGAFC